MALVKVPIEIDITYVNKTWFSNRPRKDVKHYVIGFFQRSPTPVSMIWHIPDSDDETLVDIILKNIDQGSILYSEENVLPLAIKSLYEVSEMRNNRVTGDVHVNNVKTMWRDLKRVIKQTHIQVSKKHLQLYCDEVCWKVNNRHLSDSDRFSLLIKNAATATKRPYKDLIK